MTMPQVANRAAQFGGHDQYLFREGTHSRLYEKLGAHFADGATHFAVWAPNAASVSVVGDFNDWDPRATPLHPGTDGVWTATLPLRPGRYRYTFIVDGSWRRDPAAPRALEDDFGRPTSVITIAQR